MAINGEIPIRFKLAWRFYVVGDVIHPAGVLRDWLITNGYCEIVRDEDIQPTLSPAVERLALQKRGRPPKNKVN